MKHAAPAHRTVPTRMWAAISEDVPPLIYELSHYREHLRSDLRHIRVTVTPDVKKRAPRKRNRR